MKAFALSVLAFAKAPPRDDFSGLSERLPPTLPWHKNDTAAPPPLPGADALPVPAPASGLKTLPRPFKPIPEITAKQLIALGERTNNPLGKHPVQMHAFVLLNWINNPENGFNLDHPNLSKGKPARGIFAYQLEEAYILMCAQDMWWKPLRWEGSNGVGEHVRKLTKKKKGYRYTIIDRVERRLCFYPVPAPVSARKVKKKTPEPTPTKSQKRAPKTSKQPMKRAA